MLRQLGEDAPVIGGKLAEAALADLAGPVGIGDEGPPDRDEGELLALEPAQQLVERGRLRALPTERRHELAGEPDRTHGDRGQARELLRPAGEVEVGTLELGLPEAACG